MASMIDFLLIFDDIDKSRIIPLKSGKKGYPATMYVADEVDKYGNNVSVWSKQDKEEKDSKTHRKYFANGTCFWSDGKITFVNKDNPKGIVARPPAEAAVVEDEPQGFTEENDNLPF